MSLRARNLVYAVLAAVLAFALLTLQASAQEVTWPAPVVAGGAMPVEWHDIAHPTKWDWVGLYAPETGDRLYIEWIYVSCSQTPNVGRSAGTCGFIIPSTIPPGIYELRLYEADGFGRLATSPHFQVLDGGLR